MRGFAENGAVMMRFRELTECKVVSKTLLTRRISIIVKLDMNIIR